MLTSILVQYHAPYVRRFAPLNYSFIPIWVKTLLSIDSNFVNHKWQNLSRHGEYSEEKPSMSLTPLNLVRNSKIQKDWNNARFAHRR